jgi:hypothetical protein
MDALHVFGVLHKKVVQVEVIFRQLLPLTGQNKAQFHFRFSVTDLT